MEKVAVDTDGLTQVTNQLSISIESLSNAMKRAWHFRIYPNNYI
jgi:hypothetical protein